MLDLIRCFRLPRRLAALALLWLGACETRPTTPVAYFELLGAPAGTACDIAPPGGLQLQGLDAPFRAHVSGAELCTRAPIRRELPPGLYSLSWQSPAQPAELDTASVLRGPSVVSLFADQVTFVRVQLDATPAGGASDVAAQLEPTACSGSS
jgi:hypothetical protein